MTATTNKAQRIVGKFQDTLQDPRDYDRYDHFLGDQHEQSKIKLCIKDDANYPQFFLSATQTGKTEFAIKYSDYLLKQDLADIVILTTTNNTDALLQLETRVDKRLSSMGYQVFRDDTVPNFITGKTVIITMKTPARLKRLHEKLINFVTILKQQAKPLPKIYLFQDEGEEFDANHVDNNEVEITYAQTEEQLYNIKNDLGDVGVEVDTGFMSATLDSLLLTNYLSGQKDLHPWQVYNLPNSSTYKGIGSGIEFLPVLSKESPTVFKGLGWQPNVQAHQSVNIVPIVNVLEKRIADREFKNIPIIANIVYGTAKDSHRTTAQFLKDEFESRGTTTAIYNGIDYPNFEESPEVVIVIHNGSTSNKSVTLMDKLRHLNDHYRKTIEGIFIVADKKANKSITIDIAKDAEDYKRLYDPNDPWFGWYCCGSIVYGADTKNIEADTQYMRGTGNRPDLQKHFFVGTKRLCDEIENYYTDQKERLDQLRNVGVIKTGDILPWGLNANTKIGKARTFKLINKIDGRGKDISKDIRKELLANSYASKDELYRLTPAQLKKVGNSKQDAIDFVVEQGFGGMYGAGVLPTAPEDKKVRFNSFKNSTGWKAGSNITQSMQAASNGSTPSDWVITVCQDDEGPYLYVSQNEIWKNYPRMNYVLFTNPVKHKDKITWNKCRAYAFNKHGRKFVYGV